MAEEARMRLTRGTDSKLPMPNGQNGNSGDNSNRNRSFGVDSNQKRQMRGWISPPVNGFSTNIVPRDKHRGNADKRRQRRGVGGGGGEGDGGRGGGGVGGGGYGALKRVTLAVTDSATSSPELIDCKYSVIVVEERKDVVVDRELSRTTALKNTHRDDDWIQHHQDDRKARCNSTASKLTSTSRRHGPSYGTNNSRSGVKLAPDDLSCASTAVTVDSNSGTSAVVTVFKTKEAEKRDRLKLCKHYTKKFVALMFSTVGVLSLMVGYTILGGYMFMRLEAPNEVAVKADVRRAMRWHVATLWSVTEQLNVLHRNNWTVLAERVLDNFTREVFLATKHRGYEYGTAGDRDNENDDLQYGYAADDDDGEVSKLQWNFAGSLLYSITVITTIGYGNIAPKTPAGMIVTMLYAIVGIPLTLFTITNLGRLLATIFRFVYKNLCCIACCILCGSRRQRSQQLDSSKKSSLAVVVSKQPTRTTVGMPTSASRGVLRGLGVESVPDSSPQMFDSSWRSRLPVIEFVTDVEEIQKVSVPISVSLALIAGYVALGSVLFRLCEDWDYLVASYFCFITLSTIGFGDYVPGTSLDAAASQEKMVLCAMYLVFGLAMLAMCFDLMQEEARNKFDYLGRRLGLIDDNTE